MWENDDFVSDEEKIEILRKTPIDEIIEWTPISFQERWKKYLIDWIRLEGRGEELLEEGQKLEDFNLDDLFAEFTEGIFDKAYKEFIEEVIEDGSNDWRWGE